MSTSNVLAIIPARGGSKRLPRKNIKPLNGKPLVAYSIEAAINAPIITDVIVSSEDEEICNIASNYNVEVVKRPDELAADNVSNEQVVKHAIEHYAKNNEVPEYIVLLQPTSPLRNASHLQECMSHFLRSAAKSTLSVCPAHHHPGKYLKLEQGHLIPYTHIDDVEKRTQLLDAVYRQNGAIYALKTKDFLSELKFFQTPCLPYPMNEKDSVDVDNQFDLDFCEFILNRATSSGEKTHVC